MKKLAALALVSVCFLLLANGQKFNGSVHKLLLGSWKYKSGKYEYYDTSNKKLKESNITALQSLDIEFGQKTAKVVYPDKKEYRGSYNLSEENGKHFVDVSLAEKVVRYQILSINRKEVTVQARHSVSFYVDGDPEKKVAYGLVIIALARK